MDKYATAGAPSWIEHSGPDGAAARKFYEDVIGWTVKEMPMGDGSNYPVLHVGEESVGGLNPRPSEAGLWTVYITVDDVDATHAKAVANGARSLAEPFDAPGVGRMAHILDPFGAALAFITYESQN